MSRARSPPTRTARSGPSSRARTRSGPTAVLAQPGTSSGRGSASSIRLRRRPMPRSYDIKNAQAFNKKELTDPSQVGVRAKDDWTLEVTLEGPRGYFPVLSAYLAALPAHRGAVEKHGDKWTEAANIVCNGPFTLEAWEHNKVMVLRKNKHFIGAKDVTLDKVTIPIISVQSGALPYEGNELDMTSLQTGDLKRLRDDPRTAKQVFRYPFPGTWYLTPQVTKPPFDNVKV